MEFQVAIMFPLADWPTPATLSELPKNSKY